MQFRKALPKNIDRDDYIETVVQPIPAWELPPEKEFVPAGFIAAEEEADEDDEATVIDDAYQGQQSPDARRTATRCERPPERRDRCIVRGGAAAVSR